MAERIPPLNPLPNDKAFAPRGTNEADARGKDKEAADALVINPVDELAMPNNEKIAAWEAQAQDMANNLNCAVLLHYSALPHFEWTGPTMRADFIPGTEVAYVPPAPPA